MSISVPSASADVRALVARRLPLSARVFAGAGRTSRSVSWGGPLPALPRPLADAVAAQWGLTIAHDLAAPDPFALPAFTAAFAQTRADQVVRAFSRRTNLVLSGATAAVVGSGPIADAVAATLTRIGSRVIRITDDPVARLRGHLAGLETADLPGLPAAAASAHYVIGTGEAHPPLSPADFAGVLADGSLSGGGLAAAQSEAVRPHVGRLSGSAARVVAMPAPFPSSLDTAEDSDHGGLAWRLADLLIALSLLADAARGDATAADIRLAEELIA